MKILDAIIGPLVVLLLILIAFLYTTGGSNLEVTKKLIRWTVVFIIFAFLARACIPHG